MKAKLVFLLAIVLLSASVFAGNVGVVVSSPPTQVYVGQDYNYQAIITSDTNGSAQLQFIFDGTTIQTQNISFVSGSQNQSFTVQLPTPKTNKTATLSLAAINFVDSSLDSDPTNDNSSFTLTSIATPDLQPQNLLIAPIAIHAGQDTNISVQVTNLTSQTATNYTVQFLLDATVLNQAAYTWTANEVKNLSFVWHVPANLTGSHQLFVKVNPGNTLPETSYANNSVSYAISNFIDADLSIVPSDINALSNFTIGNSTTTLFTVRNLGGSTANNISVRVYQSQINPARRIYSTTIPTLNAASSTSLSFDFTPVITGADKFIIVLDEDNTIVEGTKTNNQAQLVFNSTQPQVSNTAGYTSTVTVLKNCFVVMNNGDMITVQNFDQNGHPNQVNLSITDFQGQPYTDINSNAPFDGWYSKNQELHAFGLSVRFLQVNVADATILLIYNTPNDVRKSSCVSDLIQCNSELSMKTSDLEAAQSVLWKWQTDYNIINQQYLACTGSLNTATSDKTSCQNGLNTANAQNVQALAHETAALETQKSDLSFTYQGQIDSKQKEIDDTKKELDTQKSFANLLLIIMVIVGLVGILWYGGIVKFPEKENKK